VRCLSTIEIQQTYWVTVEGDDSHMEKFAVWLIAILTASLRSNILILFEEFGGL
jgi:hypothetical protein